MSLRHILCILSASAAFPLAAANIVCTTYPVWLLTRMLTGNIPGCTIELLAPPHGGCAHSSAPRPGELFKLQKPQTILIANGLGLDDHLIAAAQEINSQLKVITASVPAVDAHTFASPDTAGAMLEKIAGELERSLPEYREHCRKNLQKLRPVMQQLVRRVENLPCRDQYIVLHHKIFLNLLQLSGAKAVLLKHEKDSQITAAELMHTLRTARQQQVVILWTDHAHDPVLKIFLRAAKLPAVELDMLLSGPPEPPADYYVQVMNRNLDKLERTLRK